MSYKSKKDDDAAMGCIVYALLALFLMPIVGLFLVFSKEPEKRMWGWILLIGGIILCAVLGLGGA